MPRLPKVASKAPAKKTAIKQKNPRTPKPLSMEEMFRQREENCWRELLQLRDEVRLRFFNSKPEDEKERASWSVFHRISLVRDALRDIADRLGTATDKRDQLEAERCRVSQSPEAWFDAIINRYGSALGCTETSKTVVTVRVYRTSANRWGACAELDSRSMFNPCGGPVTLVTSSESTLVAALSALTGPEDPRPLHEQVRKDLIKTLFRSGTPTTDDERTVYALLNDAAEYAERGDKYHAKNALRTASEVCPNSMREAIEAVIARVDRKLPLHTEIRTRLMYPLFPAESRLHRTEWQNAVYEELSQGAYSFERGDKPAVSWAYLQKAQDIMQAQPPSEDRVRVSDAITAFMKDHSK